MQSPVHGHKQDAEVVYCLLLLLLLIVNIYVCSCSAEVCLIFHVDCKFTVSLWSNVHLWSITSLDLWMCTTKSIRFPHFGRRGGGPVCIQGVWTAFRDTLWWELITDSIVSTWTLSLTITLLARERVCVAICIMTLETKLKLPKHVFSEGPGRWIYCSYIHAVCVYLCSCVWFSLVNYVNDVHVVCLLVHARERERERGGQTEERKVLWLLCRKHVDWWGVGVGGECQTPVHFFHCLIKRRADKLAVPCTSRQLGNTILNSMYCSYYLCNGALKYLWYIWSTPRKMGTKLLGGSTWVYFMKSVFDIFTQ